MCWGKAYNKGTVSLTVSIQLHNLEFILGDHTIILNILDWYCIKLQDWSPLTLLQGMIQSSSLPRMMVLMPKLRPVY